MEKQGDKGIDEGKSFGWEESNGFVKKNDNINMDFVEKLTTIVWTC
jgi:hypothetical protein